MTQGVARVGYHHGDLREAALAVALEALDRDRVLPSLREIASACGVSHAALYRHFESLEVLALDAAAICFQEMAAAIRERIEVPEEPAARLRIGCRASIDWALANPGRYLFMTSGDLAGKQHHATFFAAAREAFGSLVEGVAGVGAVPPIPVAHTVLTMLHGFTDFTCKGRTVPFEAESLEGQIERILDAVQRYVLSQVPSRGRGGSTPASG